MGIDGLRRSLGQHVQQLFPGGFPNTFHGFESPQQLFPPFRTNALDGIQL